MSDARRTVGIHNQAFHQRCGLIEQLCGYIDPQINILAHTADLVEVPEVLKRRLFSRGEAASRFTVRMFCEPV